MKCPNCGKQIADDSLYCEYCGHKVEKPNDAINPIYVLKRYALIVTLIVGCAAGVLIYSELNEKPVTVMEQVSSPEEPVAAEQIPASSVYMTGTASDVACSIQLDFETGQGEFIQKQHSGKRTIRSLRIRHYDAPTLILDAYDTNGKFQSRFTGEINASRTRYSGEITNNSGNTIKFSVSR